MMGTRAATFVIVCLVPLRAFAWGTGHDQVNEVAVEMLHGTVPAESAANIVKWSHTPDDFTPWEKLRHFQVSADDLAVLKAYKLESPYSLHSPRGQAVAFGLLVHALQANDAGRIAFWSACLLHALADEAACNHDPLIHYATYAFAGGYRLKTGPGVGLDFSDVVRTPEGKELVRRLAAAEAWRPLPRDPDQALLAIMLIGLENYSTADGRFLWIGGEHGGLLGRLSERLLKADPAILPVSNRYGQDTPAAQTARFRFLAEFKEALGEQPYRFVHNPNTKAGWQVPRCPYLLRPAEDVAVLAEMHLADKTVPIAGAWRDADGKPRALFIPEYLIAPYVLSEEDAIPDLSRPTLDQVGSRMLSAALSMLRPR